MRFEREAVKNNARFSVHGRRVGREPNRDFPQKGARTEAFLNLGEASPSPCCNVATATDGRIFLLVLGLVHDGPSLGHHIRVRSQQQ